MINGSFVGKVALLTASTSGIGLATARLLALAGARAVIINGRSDGAGQAARSMLAEAAPQSSIRFVQADLDHPAEIERLFERVRIEFGRLDILVHCGGAQVPPDLFINIDPNSYQRQIDGHFVSIMHCCRRAARFMIEGGEGGSIIVVASDAGKIATPSETVIGAMKAAAIMFTRTFALEMSRHAIRANVITPSIVANTKSYDRVMSGATSRKVFEKAAAKAKLGVVVPEDVAPLAVFLASPLAARITGQAISVNGGISAA